MRRIGTKNLKILGVAGLSALLCMGVCSCEPARPVTEISVSAAASLQDALIAIRDQYLETQDGIRISFNFGGSGTLAQQIEQGAPVDLFLTAGAAPMDALDSKGLLESGTRITLLSNELVMIASSSDTGLTGLDDLTRPEAGFLAIGQPETAPVGAYAMQALTNMGLADPLQERLVFAKDAREVISWVANGHAQAGVAYRTDAQTGDNVRIVAAIPREMSDPICYQVAVVASDRASGPILDFLDELQSEESLSVFYHYGFLPAPDGSP